MNESVKQERKSMGLVRCENCGAECTVFEAHKTGRLSYTCNACGSQFMARTSDSMRMLMDRISDKKKTSEVQHDESGQRRTDTGGALDWKW